MDKNHSDNSFRGTSIRRAKRKGASNRRANRLDTTSSVCKPVFSFPELGSAYCPVVVLSPFGAKIVNKKAAKLMTLDGYEIPASLKFGPFELTLKARMVSTSPDYAVVEFLSESESLANLLSEFFSVEMVATRLLPFQNFVSTPKAGSSCSTVFSDDDGNQLEIVTLDRSLIGVRGEIRELDIRFSWSATQPSVLGATSLDGKPMNSHEYKDTLLNFVKNVSGVQRDLHRITVQALTQAMSNPGVPKTS